MSTWFESADAALKVRLSVLRHLAAPALAMDAEASSLLDRLQHAEPTGPEMWRGLLSKVPEKKLLRLLVPGSLLHLGPQSFTDVRVIAGSYGTAPQRRQTVVLLSVEAGACAIPVIDDAPKELKYEHEWAAAGVFEVRDVRRRGESWLEVSLRPVAGINGLDPRRAIDLKRCAPDLS